jgi:hypothetical protein
MSLGKVLPMFLVGQQLRFQRIREMSFSTAKSWPFDVGVCFFEEKFSYLILSQHYKK